MNGTNVANFEEQTVQEYQRINHTKHKACQGTFGRRQVTIPYQLHYCKSYLSA